MFDSGITFVIIVAYLGLLAVVALWVERQSARGNEVANRPWVYALSLGVYCTAWTYYGNVGYASVNGFLYLPIYLGPTLAIVFWWSVLRKLVRIRRTQPITSIADLISARYGPSQGLAALVTAIVVIAIVPYLALQLRAVTASVALLAQPASASPEQAPGGFGLVVVVATIAFTIFFGLRRLIPTERHPGVVMALIVESAVKLIAMLAVGAFVCYGLFDNIGDIFARAARQGLRLPWTGAVDTPRLVSWLVNMLLGASAIIVLPRQFHVGVVENYRERHIRTALWLFPLYLLLITLFAVPLAMAGLLSGLPASQADLFVLLLPLHSGHRALALLAFAGGFAAATGVVVLEAMAAAIMISNHWVLPVVSSVPRLRYVQHHLLQVRWVAAALIIMVGYLYARTLGAATYLVNLGLTSFAAFLQLMPPMLAGLYWRRGNRVGATLGISMGFAILTWCLIVPIFARNGLLPSALLSDGPFGIHALRPEALFGVTRLDPLSHAVCWSLSANIVAFVVGSLSVPTSQAEQVQAVRFIDVLDVPLSLLRGETMCEAVIDRAAKQQQVVHLLERYFGQAQADQLARSCFEAANLNDVERLSLLDVVALHREVERRLSAMIGGAAAYAEVRATKLLSTADMKAISLLYADLLAKMQLPPPALQKELAWHEQREREFAAEALELAEEVQKRENELAERRKMELALQASIAQERAAREEADKALRLRDDFLAIASHELRTPLTPLRMRIQRLVSTVQPHASEAEWAAEVSTALAGCDRFVYRLMRLVDNLLDVSQISTGRFRLHLEKVDLAVLVDEVVDRLGLRVQGKDSRVHLMLEGVVGDWDRLRIEQVVVNLLTNALKFGEGKPVEVRLVQRGDWAHLSVRDYGIGVAKEDRERIFGRFQQAIPSRSFGGLGLGLYIAQQSVASHGGRISVESEVGAGSTFIVDLPLHSPASKSTTAALVEEGTVAADSPMLPSEQRS